VRSRRGRVLVPRLVLLLQSTVFLVAHFDRLPALLVARLRGREQQFLDCLLGLHPGHRVVVAEFRSADPLVHRVYLGCCGLSQLRKKASLSGMAAYWAGRYSW
jgi:hypothetical protein